MSIPKFIHNDEIRQIADSTREKYSDGDELPVIMEDIIEIKLNIDIVPIAELSSRYGIDGFITGNFKEIYVDENNYYEADNNSISRGRLRFTYAHELGHLILHKEFVEELNFDSEEDWKKYRLGLSDDNVSRFEYQAHEFAGRFLVPKKHLRQKVEENRDKIKKYKALSSNYDETELIDYISRDICEGFDVNPTVIAIRISKEKIFEELGL